ncbi:MAG: MFS transporter [Deltaproteobacteria bacterium]|nr:MFS transporter [Deltaproteobacteria bacterium]
MKVGPEGLGLLMAAQGMGGILSLSFLTPMVEKWKKETLILVAATSTPVFLILFSFSKSLPVSVALLTLVGATGVAYRTISRVIFQMQVPYEYLGRVMSVFQMDQGMRSIGSMAIGTFITVFGITLGLTLTSFVSLIFTTALFVVFFKSSGKRTLNQDKGEQNRVEHDKAR